MLGIDSSSGSSLFKFSWFDWSSKDSSDRGKIVSRLFSILVSLGIFSFGVVNFLLFHFQQMFAVSRQVFLFICFTLWKPVIRFYFQVVLSLSSMVLKNSSCLTWSCGDTLPVYILSTNETNVALCGVVSYQGKVLIGILDSILGWIFHFGYWYWVYILDNQRCGMILVLDSLPSHWRVRMGKSYKRISINYCIFR